MVVFYTVEPQCNKLLRDRQNLFAIMRFCYIEVLFICFTITGVKKVIHYNEDFVRGLLCQGSTVAVASF